MNKLIKTTTLLLLILPQIVFAHPGNTDSSGGHYCRTNCIEWELSYGEYHFHNVGKAICEDWIPTATEVHKKIILQGRDTQEKLMNPAWVTTFYKDWDKLSYKAASEIADKEQASLASYFRVLQAALDRWEAMAKSCKPYWGVNSDGVIVKVSTNTSISAPNGISKDTKVDSPQNVVAIKRKGYVYVKWKSSTGKYEYVVSPKYYVDDSQLSGVVWQSINFYSHAQLNQTKNNKGKKLYFYVRTLNYDGAKSKSSSIPIQF